ncbi:flagellar M-ring protein FliF [Hasllibacter halocynthiae]|uniref:Flagellar M-ring protein n=1 Tax=Hasllibacter halocynthiae TaxID=595589 RepID=A0A2T0X2N8_9RHOB|nr:flagellar M-ring protein FliF C-terminal domain-containing protein [Hasllibacter halocynthiae]PRY93198.1 flagellar M-ring protein FliF [Hasllibacter halocynthiae]
MDIAGSWNALGARRRMAVAGAAALATVLAVLAFAWGGPAPRMELLYGGLDERAAGQVLSGLEARGVPYEVRSGAIYVPGTRRDALRLQLAAEGLPAAGPEGYELLDGLSGLGTTDRMFDAAYWRAREGELARTIAAAMPGLAVRVHLAAAPARGLARRAEPSASVSLTGGAMPAAPRLRAIRHLVAAAVPGLDPAAVSVIGPDGVVVDGEVAAEGADGRGAAIAARARRLLEARVGPGRARVEVGLELVDEVETLLERRIDPESRTVISTETEESEREGGAPGGAVTVASNLPDGDAAAPGGPAASDSRLRSRTNYDISESERRVERAPGAIRRMTVAVLVDEARSADGTPAPRTAEELEALRALVASAAGLDEGRGDVLVLHSMAFDDAGAGTIAEAAGAPAAPLPLALIVKAGAALLAIVFVGLFVVRPLTRSRPEPLPAGPAPTPALPPAAPSPAGAVQDTVPLEPSRAPVPIPAPPAPPPDPRVLLGEIVAERPDEGVAVIRRWLEEEDA